MEHALIPSSLRPGGSRRRRLAYLLIARALAICISLLRCYANIQKLFLGLILFLQEKKTWPARRRYLRILRRRVLERRRRRSYRILTPHHSISWGTQHRQMLVPFTGLSQGEFISLYERAMGAGCLFPSTQKRLLVSPAVRLQIVLHWLRTYSSLNTLAYMYNISPTFISSMIRFVLPRLRGIISNISPPLDDWPSFSFEGTPISFMVDCTPHYRVAVHPGQYYWYRSDKSGHFMSAQVILLIEKLTTLANPSL